VIAWGREPDVLLRLAAGEPSAPRWWPDAQAGGAQAVDGRPPAAARRGHLVDAGAVLKLRDEGKSLLPIGVTEVQGEFARGDVIAVRTPRAPNWRAAWPTTRRPRRGSSRASPRRRSRRCWAMPTSPN
jgi:glutamate 5-kinase